MSVEDKKKSVHQKNVIDAAHKEVEKYIKFFVLKSLQAIVSSRIGIHNKTRCKPAAKGQDWFNIALHECEANRRLQAKVRDIYGKKIPTLWDPISLDIILRTFDGNYIILETWQLSTNLENKDPKHKNHFSIYNRLGILLKSVLSISRVLPSFNLAKKNEKDFSLFFKVHTEVYSLHQYELHNSLSIGFVKTPIGTVNIKTMYRSKVWLSGSFHAHTYKISDPDSLLPLFNEKDGGLSKSAFQSIDMFENELALAVSDQEWINSTYSTSSNVQSKTKHSVTSPVDFSSVAASIGHEDGLRQIAAFVEPFTLSDINLEPLDLPKLPPTPPFQSLLPGKSPTDNVDANLDHDKGTKQESNFKSLPMNKRQSTEIYRQAEAVGFEDDFVLVELRPAFFSEDDTVGNLYKQCQSPVPLDIFTSLEQEDQDSESIDLDAQLEKCRKELMEYQEFFSDTLKTEKSI
ncbi:autophagy-related protein 13 homolog [Clytia hemisphaerica]